MEQFTYGTGTKSLAEEVKPADKGQRKGMGEIIPIPQNEPAAAAGGTPTPQTPAEPATGKDYINQMYDSNLNSQKAQLRQNYEQGVSDLDARKQKTQQQTDANLSRTYIEAEKARKNYAEVQNAYGLTSGAMGQARLAQDNQLRSDMTAIRAAQQEADAQIERERSLLAKEFANAIAQAQANNDFQRAQALYRLAQQEEERLLANQKNAAALMAGVGDYSLYAQLYGLTPEQLAKLQEQKRGSGVVYIGGPAPGEEDDTELTGDNGSTGTDNGGAGQNRETSRKAADRKVLPTYLEQTGGW